MPKNNTFLPESKSHQSKFREGVHKKIYTSKKKLHVGTVRQSIKIYLQAFIPNNHEGITYRRKSI
jgi:hypothetical protein